MVQMNRRDGSRADTSNVGQREASVEAFAYGGYVIEYMLHPLLEQTIIADFANTPQIKVSFYSAVRKCTFDRLSRLR